MLLFNVFKKLKFIFFFTEFSSDRKGKTMEGVNSNSITICLPPSVNLSELNQDSLRSMIEAHAQQASGQPGEFVLYVKDPIHGQEQLFVDDQSLLEADVGVENDMDQAILLNQMQIANMQDPGFTLQDQSFVSQDQEPQAFRIHDQTFT